PSAGDPAPGPANIVSEPHVRPPLVSQRDGIMTPRELRWLSLPDPPQHLTRGLMLRLEPDRLLQLRDRVGVAAFVNQHQRHFVVPLRYVRRQVQRVEALAEAAADVAGGGQRETEITARER